MISQATSHTTPRRELSIECASSRDQSRLRLWSKCSRQIHAQTFFDSLMHERTEERYYLRTRTAWCAKASRGLVFKGLYFNLERSNARRQRIEGELFGLGLGTLYNRLPATDGATSEQRPPLRAGELGCYLSHLRALEIAAESDRPMHILEDDARLSKLVPAVLPAANRLFQNADIVFLDVALPYELAIWQMYRDHIRPGQLSVINLAGSAFSSTTSYVVSPQGPERFAISVQQNLTTRHAGSTLSSAITRGTASYRPWRSFPSRPRCTWTMRWTRPSWTGATKTTSVSPCTWCDTRYSAGPTWAATRNRSSSDCASE